MRQLSSTRRPSLCVGLIAISVAGCRCGAEERDESTATADSAQLSRGDRVVVEQSAALFFEGRVLSIGDGGLTVQTADGGDPVRVAASDTYRLAGDDASAPRAGTLAICARPGARWIACRVESVGGVEVRAIGADGGAFAIGADEVLRPSAVTELNLKRYFEKARQRHDFERAAAAAGRPRAPVGWKPGPRERVLAEREDGWYSAEVVELDDDEVRIAWRGRPRESWVRRDRLIPEPPYVANPLAGSFGLARPEAPSQVWRVVRIQGVRADALSVADANGRPRTLRSLDFVPLVPTKRPAP